MYDSDRRPPQAIVAELEDAARRFETPCGEGALVWRAWGEGAPVMLLHGAHGAWTHWIRNIGALTAAGRAVLAPDLPGFGDSTPPPVVDDPRSYAEALAEGLARLPFAAPLDVVGFSTGAVLAAHMAAVAPGLVRRLVLVDAGGLGTPLGAIQSATVRGLEGAALREAHRANLLGLMLHADDAVDDLALHVQAANVPRARVRPAPLVIPDQLLRALPHVRCPIDLVWGEHDRPHPNPQAQAAVVRRHHPDAGLRVIRGAGHWVMYERAEAFNAELLGLLAAPPP